MKNPMVACLTTLMAVKKRLINRPTTVQERKESGCHGVRDAGFVRKRTPWRSLVLLLAVCVALPHCLWAQAYKGYTLYSAEDSRYTYLLNMSNTAIHSWTHTTTGGYSCYLLEDGTLLRPALSTNSSLGGGGEAGIVQRIAWDGTIVWQYTYSGSTYRSHHDIEPMPNGDVLLIAWEVKTATQAVQAGLDHSASIWPDHIVEIQPSGSTGGNIVWQWHAWDHLIQHYDSTKSNYGVIANHPELLDINMGSTESGDWMHINSIKYNSSLDQIIISSHWLNEIYVIDHSTTTAQAASHSGGNSGKGGDILYRWGMPSNYGASGTQYFDVVHCAIWIPDSLPGGGHIMAFNNGDDKLQSTVVELVPPVDSDGNYTLVSGSAYGPSSPIWTYTASSFYSDHLGSCQRLPNGNTLIAESTSGYLFEVDTSGNIEWSYSPGGDIARVLRYSPSYAGLLYAWPTVKTPTIASIASTTATLGATVSSQGSATVSERGIVWSTTASPDTLSNRVSTSGTTGSYTVAVSSFPAGALIHFRGYAINSIGAGYTSDTTFYTLSTEPSSHVSGFTGTAISGTQAGLSWDTATGAVGYVILERAGADPTSTPSDGVGYTTGTTIGDGVVAAVVASGTTTSATVGGLTSGTTYHFSIIPFAWDGSDSATCNYKTDGTIPTTSVGMEAQVDTLAVSVSSGWQMISNPVVTSSDSARQLYPSAISSAFKYNGSYKRAYVLDPGIGYWLKFSGAQSCEIIGTALLIDTIDVTSGWNLIGSISEPLPISAVEGIPVGMTVSNFYGFQSKYTQVDTIQPGKAYWVKVSEAGQLILSVENASLAKKSSSQIQIVPTSEMPPDPPADKVSIDGTPTTFALCQNHPNPFNPTTRIDFEIPTTGRVVLKVYDMLGREVATLTNEIREAGRYTVNFNAGLLPSGVYVCKMSACGFTSEEKLVLIK